VFKLFVCQMLLQKRDSRINRVPKKKHQTVSSCKTIYINVGKGEIIIILKLILFFSLLLSMDI